MQRFIRRDLIKSNESSLQRYAVGTCFAVAAIGVAVVFAQKPTSSWRQEPACETLTMAAAGGPMPRSHDVMVFRYVGSSNYEMAYRDSVILFDAQYERTPPARPLGVTRDQLKKVTAVYIGHGHADHMADGPFIAEQAHAPMFGAWPTTDAAKKMGLPQAQNITVKNGDVQKYPGFTVESILAHHSARTPEFAQGSSQAYAALQKATGIARSTEEQSRARAEFGVRGSSDPHIADEGTMAFLVTFDTGYKLIVLDSSGPVTDAERVAMQRIGGKVDVAIVAYQGFYVATRQIEATLPLVKLFKPDVFLPTHHDETAGAYPDMATYPLFMSIRDEMPGTQSISPLYRTPLCFNMRTKEVLVGEPYTWPPEKRRFPTE